MPSGSAYLLCTYAVSSLAQLILTQLPEGALLKPDLGGLPMIYRQHWPAAAAESFALTHQMTPP
jgi:hypothetical protein